MREHCRTAGVQRGAQGSECDYGELVRTVPASLAVFRVGADGKLDFVRTYDVAASEGRNMFWMGIVPVR